MLSFLVFVLTTGISLRHPQTALVRKADSASKLDPHCSEGIMNTEMTFCCQKDCGECSDTSDLCSANRTDAENPHGRESTCCPRAMEGVPSCENSMAPCAVPKSVRNPPDLASLTDADRHAKDDCGDAVKDTRDTQHLSTAYIKQEGKSIGATTADCGNYGDDNQAAAACSNKDDCMGFSSKEGKPDCLYIAGTTIEETSDASQDLYLKREEAYTGATYKLSLGKCTVECGGGTRPVMCHTSSHVTVNLGMCTTQVAMNADAMLEEEHCHTQPCGIEHSPTSPPPAQPQCAGCHTVEFYYTALTLCEDVVEKVRKGWCHSDNIAESGCRWNQNGEWDSYYYYYGMTGWNGEATGDHQRYTKQHWFGAEYNLNVTYVCDDGTHGWPVTYYNDWGPVEGRNYYYRTGQTMYIASSCAC